MWCFSREEQQQYITAQLPNIDDAGSKYVWLGVSDKDQDGTFAWTDGEVASSGAYVKWDVNQPRDQSVRFIWVGIFNRFPRSHVLRDWYSLSFQNFCSVTSDMQATVWYNYTVKSELANHVHTFHVFKLLQQKVTCNIFRAHGIAVRSLPAHLLATGKLVIVLNNNHSYANYQPVKIQCQSTLQQVNHVCRWR